MNCVVQFFQGIARDVEIVLDESNTASNRDLRISSICARVGGCVVGLRTLSDFVVGIVQPVTGVVAAIGLLASTVLGFVVAHDLIRVGLNQSYMTGVLPSLSEDVGIVTAVRQYVGHLTRVGRFIYDEQSSGVPYSLHGTLLFKPVYEFCKEFFKVE